MEEIIMTNYHIKELTLHECSQISGGDKFTESVFRFLGYVSRKLHDIDWSDSSWANDPRAQR